MAISMVTLLGVGLIAVVAVLAIVVIVSRR